MTSRRVLIVSLFLIVALDARISHPASEGEMQKGLNDDLPAVDLSTLKTLSAVVEKLAQKKIVYVGEEHDKFSHHQVQLEVLRGLYRQTPKIAVGMEMFQRPFQGALDDYIAGAIDERTFLKRSEYFKRWNIDYHLYKPILDFAKDKRFPVIALNAPHEIVDKVAKEGFGSLSEEEKRQIPRDLDFSDQEYRARLKEVFVGHGESQERNFEFFYQAQILWDETMAESIDGFLKKNPDFRVLALAGAGHLQYGSGIPRRSFRRNGLDFAIVLSDVGIQRNIADFVVFPEASKAPATPRLGVLLDERSQRVRITGFTKESVAERAGLKVDDGLVSLDDYPVVGVDDVRIALFYKRATESIKVKARRAGEELEFNVKLQ
jgi:aminopeptidase N